MKNRTILVALAAWFAVGGVVADAPGLISYQTRLEDAVGSPITVATQLRIRLYQGGDGTTNPSTGTLVYHELATVTPSADGVVAHLIGTGIAQGGCIEGTCQLAADDFPDGATAVWIEVMVDPNGTLGDGDDDVLLPRTRFGAVGYAMHADTLDGRDSTGFLDTSPNSQTKTGTLTLGDLECTDCIDSGDIASAAVTSLQVANNSLTASDLGAGSVGSSEVVDNSLTAVDLAAGSVGSSEVADNSLTANDLATNAVGAAEIAAGAVGSSEVATDSLTASDLAANSVGSSELASSSVTNAKLALTPAFHGDYATTSTTEQVNGLGVHDFCALSKVQHSSVVSNGTNIWCRVWNSGSNWYLGVRSNGTTLVTCGAVCL